MGRASAPDRVALQPRLKRLQLTLICFFLAGAGLAVMRSPAVRADAGQSQEKRAIGREVAIPKHLTDGEENRLPLGKLLAHGRALFDANWTDQEGGGRP